MGIDWTAVVMCFWNIGVFMFNEDAIQCSFDNDLCGFTQSSEDQFNWTLRQGQTPTINTGPNCDPIDCDHGQYLYIETSLPRRYNDKARLETPYLGGSGKRCLSFYYHMYGYTTGTLKVKQHTNVTDVELILWEASGNQGDDWHRQSVRYRALNLYKIVFEAYVGTAGNISYKGDIAIDDIHIEQEDCTGMLMFECDFERSVCGWQNVTESNQTFQLDWFRHKGSTFSRMTGPSQDRHGPDGHYIYVESSRSRFGDLAQLLSPSLVSSDTGYCVEFYYHKYGRWNGNLTMFLVPEGGTRQQLWEVLGNQGDSWHYQAVNISSEQAAQDFKIMFEASVDGFSGDAALDDLKIHKSLCGT